MELWLVDGVLIDGALSTIDFTENHDVRVIVRDERGASASDRRTVVCE